MPLGYSNDHVEVRKKLLCVRGKKEAGSLAGRARAKPRQPR